MTKLTDAQLFVRTCACKRTDGLAVLPVGTKPAAAAKLAASLGNKGLVREIRAKPGAPVWSEDAEGRTYSLKLLKAGRDAIGVTDDSDQAIARSVGRKARLQASKLRTCGHVYGLRIR